MMQFEVSLLISSSSSREFCPALRHMAMLSSGGACVRRCSRFAKVFGLIPVIFFYISAPTVGTIATLSLASNFDIYETHSCNTFDPVSVGRFKIKVADCLIKSVTICRPIAN